MAELHPRRQGVWVRPEELASRRSHMRRPCDPPSVGPGGGATGQYTAQRANLAVASPSPSFHEPPAILPDTAPAATVT